MIINKIKKIKEQYDLYSPIVQALFSLYSRHNFLLHRVGPLLLDSGFFGLKNLSILQALGASKDFFKFLLLNTPAPFASPEGFQFHFSKNLFLARVLYVLELAHLKLSTLGVVAPARPLLLAEENQLAILLPFFPKKSALLAFRFGLNQLGELAKKASNGLRYLP